MRFSTHIYTVVEQAQYVIEADPRMKVGSVSSQLGDLEQV